MFLLTDEARIFWLSLRSISTEDLGGSYIGASNLALPLPLLLSLEVLSIAVDWTTCTSKVLLGLDEFLEGLLEPLFEIDFIFEEAFTEV